MTSTKNDGGVMLGAGPFFFGGSETGLLMIHGGGGGSASDLRQLGSWLNEHHGWTVRVPLLKGFGTTPRDLRVISPETWITQVNAEIDALATSCKDVIVLGHSMGGLLSLVAGGARDDIDGIIALAPALGVNVPGFKLARYISWLYRWVKTNAEGNKERAKAHGSEWVGYDQIPTNIAMKLQFLIKKAKQALPAVRAPVLVIQGALDAQVVPGAPRAIVESLPASTSKRTVLLPGSEHALFYGPDLDVVHEEIFAFVDGVLGDRR